MSTLDSFSIITEGKLAKTDRIALEHDLTLDGTTLVDSITGSHHRIHRLAVAGLVQLRPPGIAVHQWLSNQLDNGISNTQAREVLHFLDLIGGLQVTRERPQSIRFISYTIQRTLLTRNLPLRTIRSHASFWFICREVYMASLPLFIATGFTEIYIWTLSSSLAVLLLFAVLLIYVSSVFHEWGHVFILKKYTVCRILRRGMHLAILHAPLSPAREAQSALLGPLIASIGTWLIGTIFFHTFSFIGFLLISVGISFLHLSSLLPFFSDGRSLLQYIHSYACQNH